MHYIKYQKEFPIINIAYTLNDTNFDNCLVSIISILKNSIFESINIILLYNDAIQIDLEKVNKLKEIHSFTLYNIQISNSQFKNFPFSSLRKEETWYRYILADKFHNLDRILYLDCNTIVRKSLLPLLEFRNLILLEKIKLVLNNLSQVQPPIDWKIFLEKSTTEKVSFFGNKPLIILVY